MPPPSFRGPRVFQSPLLQPPLHKLFIPRPRPDYLPPADLHLDGYRGPRVTPVGPYIGSLDVLPDVPYVPTEPPSEQRRLKREATIKKGKDLIEAGLETWKPQENPNATSEALKTLFVGRLAYDVTERQLKREFEVYGEISEIKMVTDSQTGKFKGYAFIQFASEEDMKSAYKDADAKKINDHRIVVDVERGRTVKDWRPRRLGGGLGRSRAGAPAVCQKSSGRDSRGSAASGAGSERDPERQRERSRSPEHHRRDGHQRGRDSERSYRPRR